MSDFNTLLAVKDLMTTNIVTAPSGVSITDVAKKMADQNISSIVLTNETGEFAGIITESDIVRKAIAGSMNLDVTGANIVMSEDTQKIHGDASIFEARKIMTESKVKHMLVEEEGKPIGLISATALLG